MTIVQALLERLTVYDLDTLVSVNKSESVSNMDRSKSSSIVNQNISTYVCSRFRERVIEDDQNESTDKIKRWAIAIIREPFLL
jgi:hypothetical protein